MSYRFQIRRDVSGEWVRANPVLLDGEIGYETDTHRLKIGDGSTAWDDLAYFVSSLCGETVFDCFVHGDMTVGTVYYVKIQSPCTLTRVSASLETCPSGSDVTINVLKNGTTSELSVLTENITITPSQPQNNGVYTSTGTIDPDRVSCVEGDVIFVFVEQIGSDVAGKNLSVQIGAV